MNSSTVLTNSVPRGSTRGQVHREGGASKVRCSSFLLAVVACVSGLLLCFVPLDSVPWSVGLSFSMATVVLWIFHTRALSKDLLQPAFALAVWYVVFAVVAPIKSLVRGWSYCPYAYPYIPAALVLSAFGFSLFLIGYTVAVLPEPPPAVRLWQPPSKRGIIGLVLVVWAGSALFVLGSRNVIPLAYGMTGWWYLFIPALTLLLAGDMAEFARRRWTVSLLVIPAIFWALQVPVALTTKQGLFHVFGLAPLVAYLLQRRVRLGILVVVAVLVVLVAAGTFPTADYAKKALHQGQEPTLREVVTAVVREGDPRLDYIESRLSVVEFLAGMVRNEDREHPRRPRDRIWLFYGSLATNIPRVMWPGKPSGPDHGAEIGRHLDVLRPGVRSGVATSVVGYLLWHYGFLGVALGMPILGAFTGAVYSYLARLVPRHWGYLLAYVACLLCFLRIEAGVGAYVAGTVRILSFVVAARVLAAAVASVSPGRGATAKELRYRKPKSERAKALHENTLPQ